MVNLYTPSTAKDIALTPKDKSLLLTLPRNRFSQLGKSNALGGSVQRMLVLPLLADSRLVPSCNSVGQRRRGTGALPTGQLRQSRAAMETGRPRGIESRNALAVRFGTATAGRPRGRDARTGLVLHESAEKGECEVQGRGRCRPGPVRAGPESIRPVARQQLRPNGQACRIKAFSPGYGVDQPDTEFFLSEFADPDDRAIYFRLRDLSQGVKDELLGPVRRAMIFECAGTEEVVEKIFSHLAKLFPPTTFSVPLLQGRSSFPRCILKTDRPWSPSPCERLRLDLSI